MRKLTFLVLFLITAFSTFAQTASDGNLPRFSASDLYIHFGGYAEWNAYSSLQDFKTLAPGSVLLAKNLDGYTQSYNDGFTMNPTFSVFTGFHIRNSEGTAYLRNPLIRAGITYVAANPYRLSYSKDERVRYDTLTSDVNGITMYLDSLTYHFMDMNYNSDQLRLDFSAIFRTDPAARWSLYGGVGINFGWAFNNTTKIDYSEYSVTEMRSSTGTVYNYYYPDNNDMYTSEVYHNKSSFTGSLSLPLGIDFKIARKSEFWSRLHLYYEFRPGVSITTVPELRSETRANAANSFGLRINWAD